ncbi:hypothetical protein AmDm5_0585 [Acetobacter malorum]|nr:hypothetical protein AmDm5_0585 [Acetobacter malorum]
MESLFSGVFGGHKTTQEQYAPASDKVNLRFCASPLFLPPA